MRTLSETFVGISANQPSCKKKVLRNERDENGFAQLEERNDVNQSELQERKALGVNGIKDGVVA